MKDSFILKINSEKIFTFGIYLCIFIFLLFPYTDYDWGWHYRYGEYFIKTGNILRQDIWSWTLPGYEWINHEWLYDPLLYILYNFGSFTLLSIAGAVIGVLIFYISTKDYKLGYLEKGILAFFFVYLSTGVIFQGLRSQVIGLFMLALNMYIIRETLYNRSRVLFIFPFFYLLWANLHGTFVLGLLIFGLAVFQSFLNHTRKKEGGAISFDKYSIYFLLSFLASVSMTFINPFTYHVYLEALRHFNNPVLTLIVEWIPVEFLSPIYLTGVLYALVVALFLGYSLWKKGISKGGIFEIIVFLGALYLASTARRYVAIAVVLTLPMLSYYLSRFSIKLSKFKSAPLIMGTAIIVLLQIGIVQRVIPMKLFSYNIYDYCRFGSGCSEKVTQYLLKNPPEGKFFNFYDWGGYLIGRGLPSKLFIDGRMHLWREKDGTSIMRKYSNIYYDGNIPLFNLYDFDSLLIKIDSPIDRLIQEKKIKGYKSVIEDGNAVYYVKEKESLAQ